MPNLWPWTCCWAFFLNSSFFLLSLHRSQNNPGVEEWGRREFRGLRLTGEKFIISSMSFSPKKGKVKWAKWVSRITVWHFFNLLTVVFFFCVQAMGRDEFQDLLEDQISQTIFPQKPEKNSSLIQVWVVRKIRKIWKIRLFSSWVGDVFVSYLSRHSILVSSHFPSFHDLIWP